MIRMKERREFVYLLGERNDKRQFRKSNDKGRSESAMKMRQWGRMTGKWSLSFWFCGISFLLPCLVSAHGVGSRGLDEGKKIYRSNCAVCHGVDGRGDGRGARHLNPPVPDFTRPGFLKGKSDSYLFHLISNGIEDMPGWSDKLAPGQITDVLHYLRSLAAPAKDTRPASPDGLSGG